jgi:hypothetical protein
MGSCLLMRRVVMFLNLEIAADDSQEFREMYATSLAAPTLSCRIVVSGVVTSIFCNADLRERPISAVQFRGPGELIVQQILGRLSFSNIYICGTVRSLMHCLSRNVYS